MSIVELRAKPGQVDAFAALLDRRAHDPSTLEDGCLAFDVCPSRRCRLRPPPIESSS